jgi:hypothetical protein
MRPAVLVSYPESVIKRINYELGEITDVLRNNGKWVASKLDVYHRYGASYVNYEKGP